jgi:ApaG protein
MAARVYNAAVAQEKALRENYSVTVSAKTQYLPEQSDEAASRYVFAYTISIRNEGSVAAQLISRHWIISDAQGLVQEVRGMGVVGAQPVLQPGQSYEYTSGTSIGTPVGTMRGSYQMLADDGTRFEAPIPAFTLAVPRTLH